MINWIKYFPISLRERSNFDEFQGPEFSSSKSHSLNANGNIITFRCPKHRTSMKKSLTYFKNKDVLKGVFTPHNTNVAANENWESNLVFTHGWDYYLPWFRGQSGTLSLSVFVVSRREDKKFDGASFFHPRSFEYAITNYLNVLYGTRVDGNVATHRAPVNWILKNHLPVSAASYSVISLSERLYFVFPISDTHMFLFSFAYIGSESEAEKQHMEKLAHDIIDSVKLELTPETQAKIDAVAKECGDMRLTESFPPLKWPIKPEDIENPRNDQPLPEELGLFGEG